MIAKTEPWIDGVIKGTLIYISREIEMINLSPEDVADETLHYRLRLIKSDY